MSILNTVNTVLGSFVPPLLLICGSVCTVRLVRYTVPHIIKAFSLFSIKKKNSGEHSPFGAFCLALAGTLGVGNISGVAAAIASGGAGAVFWMWICSVLCASLKYAETVLAMHFRKRGNGGELIGGAHTYISEGLKAPALGAIFCVLCVFASFTTGNITQAKAAAEGIKLALSVPEYICGALLFVLLLFFCRNGSSIYSFTLKLIPVLCIGYILLCSAVIFKLRTGIPDVTELIFSEAFSFRAGVGGILGCLCSRAVRYGVTRGVMSNEAGCGTAPIAHSSSDIEPPALQGILGIVEVLFDTLFLCTLTAYVILLSGVSIDGALSTETAVNAFISVLGDACAVPIAVAMFLFALASAASWNYYGRASLSALGVNNITMKGYIFIYSLCAFLGAVIPEGVIWQLSDVSICLMSVINSVAVILLYPIVREETLKLRG